jgi:hypothetical protein
MKHKQVPRRSNDMSSDISIRVFNKDAGKQYILIFQKPETNLNEMYDTLFPVAWKVIPLNSYGSETIIYPIELELLVKEYDPVYNADDRGTTRETPQGQMWQFSTEGDFNVLEMRDGETVDGLVGCVNKASQYVDIALSKNGTPVVLKRRVAEGDQANFKVTPKLYFAYVSDLQQGDLIKSDISASMTYELDLTNLKSVSVELSIADAHSGRKQWKESHRTFAG